MNMQHHTTYLFMFASFLSRYYDSPSTTRNMVSFDSSIATPAVSKIAPSFPSVSFFSFAFAPSPWIPPARLNKLNTFKHLVRDGKKTRSSARRKR